MANIKGRARKFGNNVDTDAITPAAYLSLPQEELKKYAFSTLVPEFYKTVEPGDIIVAGDNYGCGSSREAATEMIKTLGIKYIVCGSMARIYFRNCIAIGVYPIIGKGAADIINEGDAIEIDMDKGTVKNLATGKTASVQPIPEAIRPILEAGGILERLKQRIYGQS
jgi:3-isopropylmalate/(R)-2-methylmalate dehydratase small subunit